MSIELITNTPMFESTSESFLDFGIDKTDQSIHYIGDNILPSDTIQNPFYVGFKGGNLVKQGIKIVYTYDTVIVLLNNNLNQEFMKKYFSPTLTNTDVQTFSQDCNNCISYVRISRNILFNKTHFFKANVVTDLNLNMLFPNEKFNPTEIVLSLFELSKDDAKKYVELYKINTKLEDIKQPIEISNYYNKTTNNNTTDNLSKLIQSLKDSDFWTKSRNCKLNITNMFTVRDFQSKNESSKFVLAAQCKDREKVAEPNGDSSYPVRNSNDKFYDISTILKNNTSGDRTFYATVPDNLYTSKNLLELFSMIKDEKQLYELSNNILISKEYCHLIFNSSILGHLSKLMNKYIGAYKYSLGYAILTLYLEECLFLTKSNKNSRFVLDINTANKLPTFPFIQNEPKQNPYLSVLINNEQADFKNNCVGIKYIKNYDGYGVCDLETFKKRMNIFISGSPTKDVFEGLKWENYGVSGSIIPACLQKRNPLYDAYCHEFKDENIAFKNFVDNYYGNSDIDIMCNIPSYSDFIINAYDVYKLIMKNTDSTEADCICDTVRTIGVSISKTFFKDTLDDFNKKYGLNWTIEEYQNNIKDTRVKFYIHSKYYYIKSRMNEQLYATRGDIQNEFLLMFMKPLTIDQMTIYVLQDDDYNIAERIKDTDFVFYRNDFKSDVDKVKENDNKVIMKIGESIRFKLTYKKINKTFELFKSANLDFFSTVAKFHLPCVRAYFHNNNVYMLPSCIGAMMTGINIDYKYFAGIRDPYEIVIKYMKRGFGTILNKNELTQLKEHITKNNLSTDYIGIKEVYSAMFTQFENKKQYEYLDTNEELQQIYNKVNNTVKTTKFNAISESGNISTCVKSFFDFYYDTC